MFEEMVERIQRSVISVLLKVKIEMRPAPMQPMQKAPAAVAPAPNAQPAPAAQPTPRVFRRQMPEPLSNMSSFKAAQPTAEENKTDE